MAEKDSNNDMYTIFQDEAECKKTNFFYHGFLFVKNGADRKILEELKRIKIDNKREDRDISFKEISNEAAKTPEGKKTRIVCEWLSLARKYLKKGDLRFYLFGVDKDNLKNFWEKWGYEKSIYLRFLEIGLKSSIRWFTAKEPMKVSHAYFEKGDYNDERKEKAKWLSYEFKKEKFPEKFPDLKNIDVIPSDEVESGDDFSNFLQLTDVLLGVCKYSFRKISSSNPGREQCVDNYSDIVEKFNKKKQSYYGPFYKKFCMTFFPSPSNLTKEEFLEGGIEKQRKAGSFYTNRKTYNERAAEEATEQIDF